MTEATLLKHFESIASTPIMLLGVTAWQELLAANLVDADQFLVAWDHRAIAAFQGEVAIGLLTWHDAPWVNSIHIVLAYVTPPFRRQGVHTMMFRELVRRAQELQRPVITGGTSLFNKPMRAVFAAQGRRESAVFTRYTVPKAGAFL